MCAAGGFECRRQSFTQTPPSFTERHVYPDGMAYSCKPIDDQIDILSTDTPKESDVEVCTRLYGMYEESARHPVWQAWRKNASKAYLYREGEQWTPAELADLERRGQPPTIRNEIKPIIDRIQGQLIQTRLNTTYIGRNSPQDDPVANVLADLNRHADQQNGYEFIEAELSLDALTGGIGWYESGVIENDLGQNSIFQRAENPFFMFPDPFFTKLDYTDARYLHRVKWLDMEDVIALVPDKENEIRQCANGHGYHVTDMTGVDARVLNDPLLTFTDPKRRRLKIVETWYRRKVRKYKIFSQDGSRVMTEPLTRSSLSEIKKSLPKDAFVTAPLIVDQVWKAMWTASLLLDNRAFIINRIPFAPFIWDRRKNGEPFGPAGTLIPLQDAINKRESKSLNMLSNRRIIAEENAIKDPDLAQEENAKADGYVEVAVGALANQKVIFPDNVDIGQAQMALLQEAKAAMPRVSGISDESMGMRTEVRSGAGIARKQQMTGLIMAPGVMRLRLYRRTRAYLQLDLIREVYDEAMTFAVTDDPNAARVIQLTKSHIETIKERIYDIIVSDTPDYETLREQQLGELREQLPQMLQFGPAWVSFMLQLTDLREKAGLIKMVQSMTQPPPNQPKMSLSFTWEQLSDEEKAFMAMTQLQSPELAQFLAARSGDAAFMAKIKADLAKTKIKEGTRASLEQGKMNLSAMQTAMEGMLESRAQTADQQTQMGADDGQGNSDQV
mgnify:FL=1